MISFAVYLWKRSDAISERIFGPDENENTTWLVTAQEVQAIAFSVVGVLLLAKAFPNISLKIGQWISLNSTQEAIVRQSLEQRLSEDLIELAVKFGLGLYLFLGGKGLSRFWHKIQETKGM